MPIGAFTARPALWDALTRNPYLHSSTFGGSPMACAAGIATIEVLKEERLPERASELGDYLLGQLREVARRHSDVVKDVRGKGMLLGMEFTHPDIVLLVTAEALSRGVIVFYSLNNPAAFRIAPPLVISRAQLDRAVAILDESITAACDLVAQARAEEAVSPVSP